MTDLSDNQNILGQRVRPLSQEPLEPIERVVPVLTGQYTDQQPTEGLKLDPEREQPGFGPPGPASFSPIRQGQVPVSQGRVTVEEGDEFEKNKKNRGLLKLLLFLLIIFFLGIGSTVTITRLFADEAYRSKKGVVFSAPLKTTVWQAYGSVSEAQVELPIITQNGEIKQEFLLDTGAVVSSLPREMADKMGLDLAFLPRQTFKGFGNTTSFAYQAEMEVNLGGKKVILPVVFTEAGGSKALLGRKGLFDKFTIIVDHKSKLLEIRE